MTALNLIDELCYKLKMLFEGYTLLNKNKVPQEVRIFPQYMPQPQSVTLSERVTGLKNYTESDYEANFPSIVVQHLELSDFEENRIEMSVHKIRLLFGVFDDEPNCQGYRDILNMIDLVRNNFLVYRILANKFRLNEPMISKILDADTWPVYFGEMSLSYESGRPSMPSKNFVYKNIN